MVTFRNTTKSTTYIHASLFSLLVYIYGSIKLFMLY